MSDSTGGKYKDESPELVKGSSSSEGGASGDMDGQGLESTSPRFPKEKGSQEWQNGDGRAKKE